MDEQTIANMKSRVERCRRLARSCPDEQIATTLLQMAEETEADMARLKAEQTLAAGELPSSETAQPSQA